MPPSPYDGGGGSAPGGRRRVHSRPFRSTPASFGTPVCYRNRYAVGSVLHHFLEQETDMRNTPGIDAEHRERLPRETGRPEGRVKQSN
jgi:hypothetical protein